MVSLVYKSEFQDSQKCYTEKFCLKTKQNKIKITTTNTIKPLKIVYGEVFKGLLY